LASFSRFDSKNEELVPRAVFAGLSGAHSEGLIEDLRDRFPSIASRVALAANLLEHLDNALVQAEVLRLNSAAFVLIAMAKQSGHFDRRSQHLIEVRSGVGMFESLNPGCSFPYFCGK
jgi:hypothetical protein